MSNFNKRFGWGIKHTQPNNDNPRQNFLWLYIFGTRKEAIEKAESVWAGTWRQIKRKQNLSAVRVCLFEVSKGENNQ